MAQKPVPRTMDSSAMPASTAQWNQPEYRRAMPHSPSPPRARGAIARVLFPLASLAPFLAVEEEEAARVSQMLFQHVAHLHLALLVVLEQLVTLFPRVSPFHGSQSFATFHQSVVARPISPVDCSALHGGDTPASAEWPLWNAPLKWGRFHLPRPHLRYETY